jgi:hypothetical protein
MKQKILLLLCTVMGSFSILSAQIEKPSPRLRFSTSGCLGYQTAEGNSSSTAFVNQEKIDKFANDLRWTKTLNADGHYLFKSNWGLGLKYLLNTSSSEAEDVIMAADDNIHYLVGNISESLYINYIGLSACSYLPLGIDRKMMLLFSVSGGYAHLRDESKIVMVNYLYTGGTFAANYEFGVDYCLNSHISLGVTASFFSGNFYTINVNDGFETKEVKLDSDTRINASNMNLGMGIRYYINQ